MAKDVTLRPPEPDALVAALEGKLAVVEGQLRTAEAKLSAIRSALA